MMVVIFMTTIIFSNVINDTTDSGVYRFCQDMTGSGRTGNTLVSYHGRTAVFHHCNIRVWPGVVRTGPGWVPRFRVV